MTVTRSETNRGWASTLFGFVALGLAGCTAMSGPAHIDGFQGRQGQAFSGLLPGSSGTPVPRYIFQIHGIDTPTPDEWAGRLTDQIPKHGYVRISPLAPPWNDAPLSKSVTIKLADLTTSFDHFGQYRKDVFVRETDGETVVVYSYYWRHDLWLVMQPFLAADIQANSTASWTPNTKKSLLNSMIKAGLMDEGLSDAAGYLSPMGSLEREGIETTLCAMFADAIGVQHVPVGTGCLAQLATNNPLPDKVEFAFLSHSLGSRMLLDVLSTRDPELGARGLADVAARGFLRVHTRNFFMAANQLPLLVVGDATIQPLPVGPPALPVGPAQPSDFFDLHAPPGPPRLGVAPAPPIQLDVIAFQDPDDFLGFKASDSVLGHAQPGVLEFTDIVHRNTPQMLYVLSWPVGAHDRELEEPNSRQMILCGASVDTAGRLSAEHCPGDR
jgi:hypothetical protein